MLEKVVASWKSYRYRFVPWLALNLKERSVREVESSDRDNIVDDDTVLESLVNLLSHFYAGPNEAEIAEKNMKVMLQRCGFNIVRAPSRLQGGGTGVFVGEGHVPKGTVVAMYPGTIYRRFEPLLLQSLGNPFVFRCIDSVHIDGNDRGISKIIYKSCTGRDFLGSTAAADVSWLTSHCVNPMNIGQYVNNQNKEFPCNVAYQEYDVPKEFPVHLLKFLPNIFYTSGLALESRRIVVLVSVQDIAQREEIFSTYFTIVR